MDKLRSILIYPAIGICGFGKRRSPLTCNGEVDWINHGVGLVASYARSKGFDIDVFDMRDLDSWEQFELTVAKEKWDVIGISVSYIDYQIGKKAIDIIKKVSPASIVVVGGFIATIFPEQFLNNPNVDYVIKGEGEIAFAALLKLIEHRLKTDKLVESIRPELDDLPFVDRTLFNYERETTCMFGPGQRYPHITMIAGRGCPFHCKYCQPAESQVYGKYRIRSVDNVMQELKLMHDKYKFRSITFWDDTFTLDKKWVMEFCDKYEREGYKADLAVFCRADIAVNNEDMIKRLAEVGTTWMCIGFETGTQRMLDFIGKGVRLEQNYQSAKLLDKYDINIMGTFMMGLPTETKEESKATADMIEKINAQHTVLFYFTPIPGTHLYNYCIENDLMIRRVDDMFNIERTDIYHNNIKGIDYDYLNSIRGCAKGRGEFRRRNV